MIVSIHQIRAARAMKNWSQAELAKKTGLAVPTIAKIETGKQKPGERTLGKIKLAFEKENIEFIDNDGVKKKTDNVRILRGQKEYMEFFDLVYAYARDAGGPIYLSNVDEKYYSKWYPDFYQSDYVRNMTHIRDRIDFRITVMEGNDLFPVKSYATYRWIRKSQFSPIAFEVFGDYLAIKLFLDEPIIFLVNDKNCADLYREKFLAIWDKAIIPPHIKNSL